MPSWPIASPSVTTKVLNFNGTPPAPLMPVFATAARSSRCTLQGDTSLPALATATMGLSKSSSVNPTARSIALLGIRLIPPVMMRLRAFSAVMSGTRSRRESVPRLP